MIGRSLQAKVVLGAAVTLSLGCRDATNVQPRPSFTVASARANLLNTLSAVVTVGVQRADSARVACRADGGGSLEATPYYQIAAGSIDIAVLGLLPNTRYQCSALALGAGGAATSDSVVYQTQDLPVALAGVRLEITGSPPPGLVISEVARDTTVFTVAFDSAGRVRWYRGFDAHPGDLAM